MERKKLVKEKLIIQCLILIGCVLLGVLYYLQIEIDEDMAGSVTWVFFRELNGKSLLEGNDLIQNPFWNTALVTLYKLFGPSYKTARCLFALFFVICCWITFEISLCNKMKEDIVNCILVFTMLVPGIAVIRSHLLSTALILLFVWYLKGRKNISQNKLKIYDSICGLLLLILLYLTPDKMLFVLNVFGAIGILALIKGVKENKKILLYLAMFLVAVSVVWEILSLNDNAPLVTVYGLTSGYTSWASVKDMCMVAVPFILQTIFYSMNIIPSGTWIQPMSVMWIIKSIFVIFVFIEVIYTIRNIICEKKNDLVAEFMSLAIVISMVFFAVNGVRIMAYKNYGYFYVYNGYMGCVWFFIPLFLALYVRRKKEQYNENIMFSNKMIATVCFGIIALTVLPICQKKLNGHESIDLKVVNELKSIEADTVVAVGGDDTVTMWSGGEIYVMPEQREYNLGESSYGYRMANTFLVYTDAGDEDQFETVWDEGVRFKYGDWCEKRIVSEGNERYAIRDSEQHKIIYQFDRDIRWDPIFIPVDDDNMTFDLRTGINRVKIVGNNLEDINVSFADVSGEPLYAECDKISEEELSYIIVCVKPMSVIAQMHAAENAMLDSLVIEVIRAAISVTSDKVIEPNDSLDISWEIVSGEHYLTILGDNITDLELCFEEQDTCSEVYSSGRDRKIYYINSNKDINSFKISNNGDKAAQIRNIYYEDKNADL